MRKKMIEKMSESEGKVLGFKAIGTITKSDYEVLVPEVQTLIEKEVQSHCSLI